MKLEGERFELEPEITAKVLKWGYQIHRVPLSPHRPRSVEEGKSIRNDVYTKDVVNEVNVLQIGQTNIYKSFLADLDTWANKEWPDLDRAIPEHRRFKWMKIEL